MGNQQETITQAEIGWLAGIIEGEGSITMNARKKQWKGWNGFGVDMQVYAVNTDAGIIQKTVAILRKLGIEPYIYESKTVPIPHKRKDGTYSSEKTIMSVNVNKMAHILKVLNLIIPHIAGEKRNRAELIVDFITRRIERKGQHTQKGSSWMDDEDWEIVKDFYVLKGRELNPELKRFLNDHTRLHVSA
jgi:hypothetical protein